MTDKPQFPQAELARLADGSLPPQRAAQLRAQIEGSPELTQALAGQKHAISLVQRTDAAVAPDALRLQVDAMTQAPARRRAPRRRRWRLVLPATAALAGVAALVIGLAGGGAGGAGGGGGAGLSLAQTVRLALASPTMAAPRPDPVRHDELRVSIDGISFPNWGRPTGSRTDTIGGRRIATVFYAGAPGYRVGYSIVAGSPVPVSGGRKVTHDGIYTLATVGSARLVTWLRSGHTCVIAGREVSYPTLLRLARDPAA